MTPFFVLLRIDESTVEKVLQKRLNEGSGPPFRIWGVDKRALWTRIENNVGLPRILRYVVLCVIDIQREQSGTSDLVPIEMKRPRSISPTL